MSPGRVLGLSEMITGRQRRTAGVAVSCVYMGIKP